MTYNKLQEKITDLYLNLEFASTDAERLYFQNEILVAEEVLQDTIDKGRE